MSNGPPPARRRPSSSSGESGSRPARKSPTPPPAEPESSEGGPKLVCTAGPKAGEEFLLNDEEYVIGRATDNAISIPDSSVSRRHVQVRKLGAGWVVSDLGSGNGTLLNGEPLTDEAVLKDGDVIGMGDSELRFSPGSGFNPEATMMMPAGGVAKADATMMIQMPTARPARPAAGEGGAPARPARGGAAPARPERGGAAPARPERGGAARPERAARPGRAGGRGEASGGFNKKPLIFAVVGVVLIAGIGLVYLKKAQSEAAAVRANEEMETQEQIEGLRARFQDAKNLVRDGKWKEAKDKLEALNAEAPNKDVQTYLERAAKEIPNEENLALAQSSIEKKEDCAPRVPPSTSWARTRRCSTSGAGC